MDTDEGGGIVQSLKFGISVTSLQMISLEPLNGQYKRRSQDPLLHVYTPLPSLTHRGSMYPSPLPPPLWVHVPLSTSSPTVGPSSVYLMSLQVTKSPRPSHSIIRRHPRARNEGEIYMYICPLLTCILRYV